MSTEVHEETPGHRSARMACILGTLGSAAPLAASSIAPWVKVLVMVLGALVCYMLRTSVDERFLGEKYFTAIQGFGCLACTAVTLYLLHDVVTTSVFASRNNARSVSTFDLALVFFATSAVVVILRSTKWTPSPRPLHPAE